MISTPSEWSEIEVAQVRGKSVLITCKNLQPLKILNPAAPAACHLVLSSYGGLVAGDQIRLRLTAGAHSCLLLTSQASTKMALHFDMTAKDYLVSVTQVKEGVCVLRATGANRLALQPLCEQLMEALAAENLLGFNSWSRKH